MSATGATIKSGSTPVVFNWDYLNLPSYVGVSNWKVFIPQQRRPRRVLRPGHQQERAAPGGGPAVGGVPLLPGRDGGQNLWLQGGARPVEQLAMANNGSIDKAAAGQAAPGRAARPVFLTRARPPSAANYLAANWAKAVG